MAIIPAVKYFEVEGPPSSPPMKTLLAVKIIKQITEHPKNTATVKPSLPAGTIYCASLDYAYIALITHGRPNPKKMFTEFEPVTFPTAESALSDVLAAVILANVSGREVPIATRVIAVICGSIPKTQPTNSATVPTIPVIIPIKVKAIIKAGLPPPYLTGGTIANRSFQNTSIY